MTSPTAEHPSLALSGPSLGALELLLSGLLEPIDGYCLPGAKPHDWPFESHIPVSADLARSAAAAGGLVLLDPDATPIAFLEVTAIASDDDATFLAGRLSPLKRPEHGPARQLRLTPTDRATVVAVFADNPRPESVAELVRRAAGRPVLWLATTWNSAHSDYSASGMVDDLLACAAELTGSIVRFAPLASVDRETVDDVLGLAVSRLGADEIIDFRASAPRPMAVAPAHDGCVVLFTGFSGSGKSTVARAVAERLSAVGTRSVMLDGDDVRRVLSPGLGFTAADREENLRRIGWVAATVSSVGGIAICAPIAPFTSTRREIRAMAEAVGRFILVHVATPLDVCEARDRKGMYARARAGEISDFTGIDSPYEVPTDADFVIDTSTGALDQDVNEILRLLHSS
jgi:sulfate adenylyltransferase